MYAIRSYYVGVFPDFVYFIYTCSLGVAFGILLFFLFKQLFIILKIDEMIVTCNSAVNKIAAIKRYKFGASGLLGIAENLDGSALDKLSYNFV